jgi:hypothetical protein
MGDAFNHYHSLLSDVVSDGKGETALPLRGAAGYGCAMQRPPEAFFNPEDLCRNCGEILAQPQLDAKRMVLVAIAAQDPEKHGGKLVPAESDRSLISMTDGKEFSR